MGVKTSVLERAAGEGQVFAFASADGQRGALIEINCNTDFTAKSAPVQKIAALASGVMLTSPGLDITQHAEISDAVTQAAKQTGENIRIGQFAALTNPTGRIGVYRYVLTGKIGVLMSFSGQPTDELVKQIGGHIAFAKPAGLTRDDVPSELVAEEREIALEQAKASGKPQQIADKIAEGKLNSFFGQVALLEQEFFNAMVFKGSIREFLHTNNVELNRFVRIEVAKASA